MKAYTETVREYYKYTSEINATKVGSPTVSNGSASGFSTNNYFQIQQISSSNIVEVTLKITTGSDVNDTRTCFNSYHYITFEIDSGYLTGYCFDDGSRHNIVACQTNTTYWVRCSFNSSTKTKTYYYSSDGNTWNFGCSYADAGADEGGIIFRFGCGVDSTGSGAPTETWVTDQVFNGTIHFPDCYIKVGNTVVWRGLVGEESTASDYDYYEDTFTYKVIKTTEGTYYKYVYQSWTQPILSTNGIMGGDSFAVSANAAAQSGSGPYQVWEAFDAESNETYWRSGTTVGWLQFYNPEPLNVTNLYWWIFYSYPTGGNVQASNDGSTWTTLKTWTQSTDTSFNIDLSSNTDYYKYYRINITGVNKDVIHCKTLRITATKRIIQKSNSSDYDFYEEDDKYYVLKSWEKGQYYGN